MKLREVLAAAAAAVYKQLAAAEVEHCHTLEEVAASHTFGNPHSYYSFPAEEAGVEAVVGTADWMEGVAVETAAAAAVDAPAAEIGNYWQVVVAGHIAAVAVAAADLEASGNDCWAEGAAEDNRTHSSFFSFNFDIFLSIAASRYDDCDTKIPMQSF